MKLFRNEWKVHTPDRGAPYVSVTVYFRDRVHDRLESHSVHTIGHAMSQRGYSVAGMAACFAAYNEVLKQRPSLTDTASTV